MDRERLYERIDARTEAIVAAGAREEVVRAEEAGPSRTARKALGFDEVLNGELERMQQALAQLRPPPAHLDAQDPQPAPDRPHQSATTPTWRPKSPATSPMRTFRRYAASSDHGAIAAHVAFSPLCGGKCDRIVGIGCAREIREVAGAGERLLDRRGRRAALGADRRCGLSGSAIRTSGSAPTGCCCSRAARIRPTSPSCGSSTPTAPRRSSRATVRGRRSSTCAATAGPRRTRSRSSPPPGR